VTKFWPVAAAVGLASVAVAGITREINKTSEVQVGFFDVAQAGWQLFAEGIMGAVKPALEQIGTWFGELWDLIFPSIKTVVNGLIGGFVGAYEAVKEAWGNLPTFFTGLGKQAWNSFIAEFEKPALTWGDQVIIPGLDLSGFKSALTDAEKSAFGKATVTFNTSLNTDWVGAGLDALSERAQKIALSAETAAGGATKAIEGMKPAVDAVSESMKKLQDASKAAWDTTSDFFKGLVKDALGGKFSIEKLGEAIGDLGSRLFDIGWDLLTSALTGGFGGGGGFKLPFFAKGDVFNGPTLGVMGEAGPEAVMPLTRGGDGRLGVIAAGGRSGAASVVNHFHIHAEGAEIGVEQKIMAALAANVPGMVREGAPAAVAEVAEQDGEWRW
jgi:hypothetical protein